MLGMNKPIAKNQPTTTAGLPLPAGVHIDIDPLGGLTRCWR